MSMSAGESAPAIRVIVTRLIDPLENSLLEFVDTADKESAS